MTHSGTEPATFLHVKILIRYSSMKLPFDSYILCLLTAQTNNL
jgi:hypothetical protein